MRRKSRRSHETTAGDPLRDEGLTLVEQQRSTLEEVLRVTHAETDSTTRAERAAEPVAAART